MIDAYRRTGQFEGRCTCGEVSIKVHGDYVAAVGACHCVMCQRWTGSVFMSFEASAAAVTVTGPARDHATSEFAKRGFCGTCGAALWIRNNGEDADFELLPGMFPAAAAFPLISEIYIDCAPRYAALAGEHVRRTRTEYEADNLFVKGEGESSAMGEL